MGTGELLLRGILQQPASDDARLVYADWLEENGDGERAQFIRAHIELNALRLARRADQQRQCPACLCLEGCVHEDGCRASRNW